MLEAFCAPLQSQSMQSHSFLYSSERDEKFSSKGSIREAFVAYVWCHCGKRVFCVTMWIGMQLIACFTGVPLLEVIATLSLEDHFTPGPKRDAHVTVNLSTLGKWAEMVVNALGVSESWCRAPGVVVHTTAKEAAKRPCATTRSAPPTRRASSAAMYTLPRTSEERAMRPTRNSGSWREGREDRPSRGAPEGTDTATTATTATKKTTMTSLPAEAAMRTTEETVAAAFKKLTLMADSALHWDPKREAAGQRTLSGLTVSVGYPSSAGETHDSSGRPSPLPVPPEAGTDEDTTAPHTPAPTHDAPPSSTLADLQGFIRRGREVKVCREFVRTGACSYGARCLFHHPAPPPGHAVPDDALNSRGSGGIRGHAAPTRFPPPVPRHMADRLSSPVSWSMFPVVARSVGGADSLPLFAQSVATFAEERWPRGGSREKVTGDNSVPAAAVAKPPDGCASPFSPPPHPSCLPDNAAHKAAC